MAFRGIGLGLECLSTVRDAEVGLVPFACRIVRAQPLEVVLPYV